MQKVITYVSSGDVLGDGFLDDLGKFDVLKS